ncbi:Putative aquaporin NIP4-1 [Ancistrocladus abbreviatus]
MASRTDAIHEEEISRIEEGSGRTTTYIESLCSLNRLCSSPTSVTLTQKLVAELIGTYFVIFAGCGSVAVNKLYGGTITFPGVCVTWGLIVMVMVYSVGHISGGHFNPAVTITSAIFQRFPIKEASLIYVSSSCLMVPLYVAAQVAGSLLASGTLALIFDITPEAFFGTTPAGTNIQSFVLEIIISFLLMFVISGVTTDTRAVGELGGIAVGMTILLNVFVAGPISGASMNPARSLGPAIVKHNYKGIWVYVAGPLVGTITGAFAYNLIRFPGKSLREKAKSPSFLKSASQN